MESIPYSSLKIFLHPKKLQSLQEDKITAPVYIRIKPMNACNHKCFYCNYLDKSYITHAKFKQSDFIPVKKMYEIIKDCKSMGVKAITFSGGGEPLIYPEIDKVIKKVIDSGIDVSVITNGQKLSGKTAIALKNANWVRISMDSCNRKNYARIRQITPEWFDELVCNIRKFAKAKSKKCEFGINFVINKDNYKEVYKMIKFVKELGVNHIKLSALFCLNMDKYHKDIKDNVNRQIRRAKKELISKNFKIVDKYNADFDDEIMSKSGMESCPICKIVPIIGGDCNLYFCHDKAFSVKGVVGSLKNKSLKELWFSRSTAKKLKKLNPKKDCAHHCAYHNRVVLINSFLSLDKTHMNFI